MNKLALALCLALFACNKPAETPTGTPPAAPEVAAVAPDAAAPAASGAQLLTDDKLARFAVFRRETLSMTADVMGMAMGAGVKAMGSDPTQVDQKKFEGEMAKDDRLKAIEEKNNAALTKAGLTQSEVAALTQLTTEYYTKAMMAADAKAQLVGIQERIATAKAKKKQPGIMDTSMQKSYEDQVSEFEAFKKGFGTKHGAAVLAAMEKQEPEFIKINQEMLGALTKKPADTASKKAEGKAPAKKKNKKK